jgi:serine/threonine protein kinase
VSHRNIKLSNVLLNEDMHAMLSDIAIPRNDPAGKGYRGTLLIRNSLPP